MKKELLKEYGKLPFEKALEKLEGIVEKMEDGNLPLDQMINFFEQGNALSTVCAGKLKELEKKIEILVSQNAEGGEWKDFEENENQDEQETSTRKSEEKDNGEDSLF